MEWYTYLMLSYIFFLGEIALLFWLSTELSKLLSRILYALTQNISMTIHILSFLFLPGVILHELAHLLVANLLQVPTGEVEFFPQIQGNTVKLGSVAVAKTDPFRRFLIGVAPLLMGLGVIFALFWLFSPVLQKFSWQSVLFYYGLFEIGNTMFSSRKDLEGAIGLFILLAFIGGGLYLLGLRISAVQIMYLLQNQVLLSLVTGMTFFLLKIVLIDAAIVTLMQLLQQTLLRRRWR